MRYTPLILVTILCGISASALDEWASGESVQTDAFGGDGMSVKSELDTQITIDDDVAQKSIEARSYASDIRKIVMESSTYFTFYQNGGIYTTGYQLSDTYELEEETDISLIHQFDIQQDLKDLDNVVAECKSSVALPSTGKTSVLVYDPADIDAYIDQIKKQFDDPEFLFHGIKRTTGFSIPLSESRGGVTCEYGTGREITIG